MNYFSWKNETDEDIASINKIPSEINDNLWKLDEGISCRDWVPEDLTFELDSNSSIKLGDAIPNSLGICIVNDKLRSILEEFEGSFKIFPIKIKNAKSKISKKKYYIANLVGKVSCMDIRSLYEFFPMGTR